MRIVLGATFVVILAVLDQASKYLVLSYLKTSPGYVFDISSFLSLVVAWNRGISFGMFGGYDQYSNMVFIVINSAVICYLLYLMTTKISKQTFWSYSLIAGGAIGNVYGRVTKGAVYDFIYFHIGEYGFPAFNLADSFIFIGVCLIVYEMFLESRRK
ncbi:MAG: signal peptidase II [Rickettsiaceae bacterium]|nr:signal peptidase II [Rickettsiaceae bacterium]